MNVYIYIYIYDMATSGRRNGPSTPPLDILSRGRDMLATTTCSFLSSPG